MARKGSESAAASGHETAGAPAFATPHRTGGGGLQGSGSPGSGSSPKESRRWLKPRVRQAEIGRLAPPRPRLRRLGVTDGWRRVRSLLWNWWLWFTAAAVLLYAGQHVLPAALAAFAIICYNMVPEPQPAVYAIETNLDPGTEEFRVTMEGATGMPLVQGNRVQIFNNGDVFYPAMLEVIESARHSVTMEQYIFWDGAVGRRFAEAFAERARAGVEVKLLVDAIGSSTIGETILRTLESAGCQLAWFRPIHWYTLNRANRRTHRKSLIVDGAVAFTGGAGLADQWLGLAANHHEWRDIQVRVEGPAALAQQAGFAQNWLLTTGELLTGAGYFPYSDHLGGIEVQTILSSPFNGASAAATMVLIAMQSARECLYIANPYFIPDARVIAMLSDASTRGVAVKLMLSGPDCDSWWTRQNSVRLYGKLLQAGVEIYEYQPTMLHQKTMVVDRAWGTVGTTNLDNRSFSFNEETNVCFHDPVLVKQLESIFIEDLARCRKIEWEEWRRRGHWQQACEITASLLEDQV